MDSVIFNDVIPDQFSNTICVLNNRRVSLERIQTIPKLYTGWV